MGHDVLLDNGSMVLIEFGTAIVAVGVLEPWSVVVMLPALAATFPQGG